MRVFKLLEFLLIALLLLHCACGGGISNNIVSLQPPSALSYTTATAVYTVGTAIPVRFVDVTAEAGIAPKLGAQIEGSAASLFAPGACLLF